MQGRKTISPKLFYQVSLETLVSKDNFYRKLSQTLDLQFLYKETTHYYGTEGQASIDPVVFFKILLVGYLNKLNSDRKLMSFCANCLDVRWFLGYDLDETLPWHKAEREHFLFNEEKNQYECQRGNKAILTFKKQGKDSKCYETLTYRSSEKDCKTCPFVKECCGERTKFKKLTDSADKKYYDAMHTKKQANPQYFSRISKIRSRTVEPVLGTLTNFLNMKRVNTRGIKQANKHVLMSALCYNLKKVLKFEHHAFIGKVKSLFRSAEHFFLQNLPFSVFTICFSALRIFIPQKIKSPFSPL